MERNFNEDRRFKLYGDKLFSIHASNNLIIETSYNNIDFCSNAVIFDGHVELNRVICNNISISNVSEISSNFVYVNNIDLPSNNKLKYNSVNNGYIRNTSIGIDNTSYTIGRSDAYFTYINVSGGDASFNTNLTINKDLRIDGTLTISNDLLINGNNFASIENSFNIYRAALEQNFYSAKIVTNDLSASAISISNNLVALKTAYFNDISINGQLLNNVLKVPALFTIDPSGHGNASGTLIINGDLTVNGLQTSIASSVVDICDQAITLASNLANIQDLSITNAGLDISNIASLKYNGTLWNFGGGQLSVQNNKVLLNDDVSLAKRDFDLSINTFRSDFSSSFFALKRNIDNSYNATYSRSQITNKFILKSNFDISSTSLLSYVDSSYISKSTFTISYGDILTLMDTSYVEQIRVGALNSFTSSFNTFNDKLDISYLLNSVFEASHNKIKTDFDISFATINASNISTSASSITIENINTKHDSQRFANSLWNQIGLDISNENSRGGTITVNGGYMIHSFTGVGPSTFNPAFSGPVEVLVVGGGGGGGPSLGGGGGGGGVIWIPATNVIIGTSYEVIVGAGGTSGLNGGNSSVFGATAAGGGSSGSFPSGTGISGGCGGGAPANENVVTLNRGGVSSGNILGTNNGAANIGTIYGNRGGNMIASRTNGLGPRAAGGGGAGGQGFDTNTNTLGNGDISGASSGGIGIINGILGPIYHWGGGGGGAAWTDQVGGYGGLGGGGGGYGRGGGGNGGGSALNSGTNGQIGEGTRGGDGGNNTGGGGGGGNYLSGIGGTGGSGIVVIRYPITNNKKVAISNDGNVVAMSSSSYGDISKGRIYVYELSYNQASYSWNQLGLSSEIIVGQGNDDQFGWDVALSSNGRVVAASSIANDASGINNGQVRVYELSNNTNRWTQKGSNINGPRPGSESGYSISLAGSGNRIAIGAWKDNLNGTNAGAVRVYDFSANISDWRQKGQTITGVSGSFEGYSTALSLDGQTFASASILGSSTGGTLSISGGYIIHSFTTVGSSAFIPDFSGNVEVLIVGGGGGGGRALGGGGGGGGVVYIPSVSVSAGANYTIVVGDGGNSETTGSNSTAFTAIAAGGGRGGTFGSSNGGNGGSGGGAGTNDEPSVAQQGGISSGNSPGTNSNAIVHGTNGGSLVITAGDNNTRAPGGGGAGAAGLNTNQTAITSGGQGIMYNILGTSYYWAGGGGGSIWGGTSAGSGGLGGGGGGGASNGTLVGSGGGSALNSGLPGNNGPGNGGPGGAGGANTGGGGGGGAATSAGGKGGSGIVIIRYLVTNISFVKTFTISGNTWTSKGIIRGPDINFGRSIKLSANGNAIVIGAPGYATEYRINPIYELNTTTMNWLAHRTNALTVFGRDLAVILDASQNAQVNVLRNGNQAYLGGRRKTTSVNANGKTAVDWEWVTGDAWNYTAFPSNQPDTITENVIHMWYTDGGWNDIVSGSQLTAIYMYYKAQAFNTGQAYVYGYQGGTTWTQLGQAIVGLSGGDEFGSSVSMSNDGTLISVGSNNNNYNTGQVRVFAYVNNYWYQLSNSINGKTSNSKGGIHALSGDGRTLIQTNNTYNSVYGINRSLAFIPSTTTISTTISGDLAVTGKAYLKSFRISNKHNFDVSINGYSSHYLATTDISASIVDYYSNVGYIYNKVFKIDACGNVSNYSGLYGAVSDSRLKENIVNCAPKLADLLKVRVVNYNLKGPDKTKYIGVLAQELEELFPELVVEDNTVERIKSVNYSNLTIMLIKAFQEQQVLINNLYASLKDLEKDADTL
jgi:hypothetical protein